MPSISSLRRLAIITSSPSGSGPDNATDSTGNKLTLISCTSGSSTSSGNLLRAVSTFSRTSCSANLGSKPASNSNITEACPSLAVEVIFLTPSKVRNSCSIGLTNKRSASSGLMPSSAIETYIIGIVTSGLASFGIA